MTEGSSDLAKARKAWRSRNSDGKFCLDEDGELVECQSPPAFELSDAALPAGAQTLLEPEDNEYVARAVRHVHVFDPTLVDPDA